MIEQFVASKYDEISKSSNPMAELAVKCAERIKDDLEKIFPADIHYPVFILNGVQINFEGEGVGEDYFCPLSFCLRDTDDKEHDLMPELRKLRDVDLAHDVAILDCWLGSGPKLPESAPAEHAPAATKSHRLNMIERVASVFKLR